jgi:hypothetical protein
MSKLGNIIQRKGDAPRPTELPQRGSVEPISPPSTPPKPEPAAAPVQSDDGPRTKALTVKVTERAYDRLRECSHKGRRTHQDIIGAALLRYLDEEGY